MSRKILIVASGTGGHVIPALNIAEKFIDTNFKITWIGTKRGIAVSYTHLTLPTICSV